MPLHAFIWGRHCNAPPVYSTPTLCSRATALFTILFLLSSTICLSAAEAGRRPVSPHKWRTTSLQEDSHGFHKSQGPSSELQTFFEVSTPVTSRRDQPVETIQLLYHEFANTYGVPPPAVQYIPTKRVHQSHWNKVVLKWSAVCRGRQFDRIAGVWLTGVEILRSCTAEPTLKGIFWEVDKDVTRYSSLWKEPQEVVLSIGNVVDSTYTGIINVTLSVEFYHDKGAQIEDLEELDEPIDLESDLESESPSFKAMKYSDRPADLILPISEPDYKNGGYWFQSNGAGDPKNVSLRIPPNTYRAVLEVCVSYHQNDEFWYTNPPNSYVEANNITGLPGNGSFREVVASIDGYVVGLVWPFVVVYTGGVNPLFWRPAAAIGAFDLPSYNFDITPLLGFLLDQKEHVFELSITDGLDLWIFQGNLHLWTDRKRKLTTGGLIEYSVPPSSPSLESNFQGLDGTFFTTSSRTFSYSGYVASSFGNLTTSSSYSLQFSHKLAFEMDGNLSTVGMVTGMESVVQVNTEKREVEYDRLVSSYPFNLYYLEIINPDSSAVIKATIDHSLTKDIQSMRKKSSAFSSLKNTQWSDGDLYISVNNTITGIAATKQSLSYFSTDGCYHRDISVKNYTVLRDVSSLRCSQAS